MGGLRAVNAPEKEPMLMDFAEDDKSMHYLHSTLRERIVEHIFVGDVLRWMWQRRLTGVEVLRSEFDAGGYDLVMSYKKIDRHIQFKTTLVNGKTANVKASCKLMDKPSGCIIWITVSQKLELVSYRWLGGTPGEPFPDILRMSTAKHTKGNAKGEKVERPEHRIIPGASFAPCSFDELMNRLFGPLP
jgi:hypothetical protein